MPGPILLDLSHTSHTAARTGVQRVALGLRQALAAGAREICYDPFAREWRGLEAWELANLDSTAPLGRKRGAHWPLTAKWRGRVRRAFRAEDPAARGAGVGFEAQGGLIVPEIFSAEAGAAFPALFAGVEGPKVAIFHDAIALRMPELAPPKTVARFPAYLRELARFDGVAAVSEASRAELLGFWEWAGVGKTPPVIALPLGVEAAAVEAAARRFPGEKSGGPPLLLSIGTIEARKNHLALAEACELLWQRGLKFELQLIGLPQRQTGVAALALIESLQRAGRPLRYSGAANDAAREAAYAAAAFTIYPSLAEGFGLPVAESLIRGKPCICSVQGALGEIAAGGGCLTVPEPSRDALAAACARLLESPAELQTLAAAARARAFPTPADHARRLVAWMSTLALPSTDGGAKV